MAEDVVDLTEVGGYAQIHDRERAALRSSSAGFVKRHVRWDEAWSGRVPSREHAESRASPQACVRAPRATPKVGAASHATVWVTYGAHLPCTSICMRL